jgi:2,3-diketo-5-methylthio-1-phosphopentane phosphatase
MGTPLGKYDRNSIQHCKLLCDGQVGTFTFNPHPGSFKVRPAMNRHRFAKAIVVSDFDGTIVNVDTAQVALDLYADPEWKRIEEALERGEVSFEDSLRQEFAMVRAPQETILEQLDRVTALRPNFGRLVDYCMSNGIQLMVASGGFDFCIQHFLNQDGWLRFIEIYAAKSRFTENGYVLTFPKMLTPSSINFKDDLVRREKMKGKRVFFVGNGFGDYPAAKESHFAFVIKASRLAELCRDGNVPHKEVDDFQEVVDTLSRQSRESS